jgi:hypothetical protein
MQVTADRCDGENSGARQKMENRLLLNRINIDGAGIAIDDGPQYAIDIDSHSAFTALAGSNHAQFRA